MFEAAATDLNELTDTVTYITFCENMCLLTKTFHAYNSKPWFTAKLVSPCFSEVVCRSGHRVLCNTARNTLPKEIRADDWKSSTGQPIALIFVVMKSCKIPVYILCKQISGRSTRALHDIL